MPTPFTYVYSLYVSGCATSPYDFRIWRTAYVSGTAYPALIGEAQIPAGIGSVFITMTFPNLILTQLTPGYIITFVPYFNGIYPFVGSSED